MRFLTMDFFLSLMITFFVLGILSQILIGVIYQHMIEEAENMQDTTNKLLLQLKKEYLDHRAVHSGGTNTAAFADKFINRLRIGKISLTTLKKFSGQSMFLSITAAGLGICWGLTRGAAFFALVPYYFASFLGLYLYFSVLSIVDIPGRKNILKVNLVDYLENQLVVHPAGKQEMSREKEEYEQAEWEREEKEAEFAKKRMPVLQPKPKNLDWVGIEEKQAENTYLDEKQEQELQELLRDLLS